MRLQPIRSVMLPVVAAALAGCGFVALRPATVTPPAVQSQARRTPPVNTAEVALGKALFFDPRLSRDGSISCASCHQPDKGWSNGQAVGIGIGGQHGQRNVPTIISAGRSPFQFWDGRAQTLEQQALGPITAPDEMGMPLPELVKRLKTIPTYVQQFETVYQAPITAKGVGQAIAAYERTLMAPDDDILAQLLQGDQRAVNRLPMRARYGYMLFRTKGCIQCHDHVDLRDGQFHNLGVGMDKANPDLGRYNVTKDPKDWGAFKTPTLRNVAESAPYMHDGSLKTLEDVIDFYDKGGIPNKNLSDKMQPLNLEPWQKRDLVSFLSVLKVGGERR